MDRAAVEIAATPATWPRVVNDLREALGRPRLHPQGFDPAAFQFVFAEVGGRPAMYPVARLTPLDGGGMNMVLRSWELFSGREIAVRKHLPAESAVAETLRKMRDALVRERLGTLPRHPVIQRFYTSGSIEGERCEVFDFAPGTSLTRFVARHGLTYGALVDFGLHAARGLQVLHEHGLIHADVKPENFCVEERLAASGETTVRVHLIDFDIVSSPEEQIRQYLLGNAMEGTLPYMPPENFSQDAPAHPGEARRMVFSKDVFALGLSLYRVLAADLPKNFQTSEHALLEKKVRQEEPALEFPPGIPDAVMMLIGAMCASDWTERPDLAGVIRSLRELKDRTTREERSVLLVRPVKEPERPKPAAPRAEADHVGPYRVLDRAFAPRPPGDAQSLPLAELEDPLGRRLVGVPFAFDDETEERAFYEERSVLLQDLNSVRLHHPELFPGSFRDLVRMRQGGQWVVWVLRPLLQGAIDLKRFLAEERPEASLRERVAILRRTAEALVVLEEAGYTLPKLTSKLVFFVPQPLEALTLTKATLTRPIQRLFDVPGRDPSHLYRQELMGTASARPIRTSQPPTTVADLIDIAQEIGVLKELHAAGRNLAVQLASLDRWRERTELLQEAEEQS